MHAKHANCSIGIPFQGGAEGQGHGDSDICALPGDMPRRRADSLPAARSTALHLPSCRPWRVWAMRRPTRGNADA